MTVFPLDIAQPLLPELQHYTLHCTTIQDPSSVMVPWRELSPTPLFGSPESPQQPDAAHHHRVILEPTPETAHSSEHSCYF